MIKPIRFCFLLIFIFGVFAQTSWSGDKIEVSREFNLFTSKNLEGYLKPFFTSVEESINSNIFSSAYYKDTWSIGLDVSVSGMFIPNSHTTFDAQRPEDFGNTTIVRTAERRDGQILPDYVENNIQPTIYGGRSTAIYAARQYPVPPGSSNGSDTMNRTVGYVDGNDISFMSGLPTIQLALGLPSRTQVRLRFLTLNVAGEQLMYWGVTASQRIDQFFRMFMPKDRMALAVHAGYSSATRDAGLDFNSLVLGAHISKAWGFGLTLYGGFQYEGMSGKFEAVRDKSESNEYVDSPYQEIRNMEDLSVDISSFNSFRLLGGLSYKIGIVELHADAAWAAQPILTAGLSFTFAEWGESEDEELERQLKLEQDRR